LTLPARVAVLHLSMHFIGGAERLATDLALGLADDETKVQLVTGLCHDIWKAELQNEGRISLREVGRAAPGGPRFWLNVKGFARALSRLIDPDTDVIVASSFPSGLAAQLFGKGRRAKVVQYLHEAPMVLHDREGLKALPLRLRAFYRLLSALYARPDMEAVLRSNTIIANSQLSKKANAAAYGIDESRIDVVYPGVNVERLARSPSVPALIGRYVSEDVPLVCFPRGAQYWRNPEVSLQALKRLRIPFRAVFTGGADYEAESLFSRARALGIADKVLWARELSNDDLSGLYSHSSVVVSIPRRQPFGLIPLEALIQGAPPVISRSSGVLEVLRDGQDAIGVNESDPNQLRDAIEALTSDDKMRRRIVSSGRRTILERLTSSRFVKEMREKISN